MLNRYRQNNSYLIYLHIIFVLYFSQKGEYNMKTFKLVAGILCIVFSVLIMFQSCAAGAVNTISGSDEISGSAGLITAIMFLAGGIIMIRTRNSERKGGAIANIILFLLGALVGFTNAGTYSDLKVWSTICVILAIINFISIIWKKKDKNE